jgi:hypothetical protein
MQRHGCMLGDGGGVSGAGQSEFASAAHSLNARNGQSLRDLCTGLSMARQSVSKHLAVLEAANLGVALVLGPWSPRSRAG